MSASGEKKRTVDDDIEEVLKRFHDRMRALRTLANTQLKHAGENQERDSRALTEKMEHAYAVLNNPPDAVQRAHAIEAIVDANRTLGALLVNHEQMLAEILFTSAFSKLDAFLHELLRIVYTGRPELLETKQVPFSDVLKHTKQEIIDSLVESALGILRKSYVQIFNKLGTQFKTTLKKFANWPVFVECAQRRNVITHCDGIVGSQYIENCQAEGVNLQGVSPGDRLSVTPEYLLRSIDVVTEAGLKLGQVLWRNFRDESIKQADTHLGQLIFELLKGEEWPLALRMGEFGQDCAKRQYRKPRSEVSLKIILINHAQAAKWSGDQAKAMALINGFDWSGSAFQFRLAVACLEEKWDEAAAFMEQIGAKSSDMPIFGYCGWPIFREFRETDQFQASFLKVFGVKFAIALERESAQNQDDSGKENDDAHGPDQQIDGNEPDQPEAPPE